MPDLLEVIAENDTAVLTGWAGAMRERTPQIESLPADDRLRDLLTLAREFTRRASWAVETAEGWLAELKTRLRVGMGGDKLRALLRSGRALCEVCRTVVNIADDLWRLTDAPGGEVLPAVGARLATVEAEVVAFENRTRPLTPDEVVKLFERAEARPRSGKWLTPEQARDAVLKPE